MVPVWFPLVVGSVTILCGAGAASSTIGNRIGNAERRLDLVERDREEKIRDYQQFKSDMRTDISEIKTNLRWIRDEMQRRGF